MRVPALASRTEQVLLRHRIGIPEAAARIDVDPVTVWKMTKGRRVAPETLTKFAEAFGEDPVEWVAMGWPELAAAMERTRNSPAMVREVPARYTAGLPAAPRAGAVHRLGSVSWDTEQARADWGHAMREFLVDTDSLAPHLARGDRLLIDPATTADPGDVVLVRTSPDVGAHGMRPPAQAPAPDPGDLVVVSARPPQAAAPDPDTPQPPEPDRLLRFVSLTDELLRVCDLADPTLSEPYPLPGSHIIGVVAYRITDLRAKKPRRRKRP